MNIIDLVKQNFTQSIETKQNAQAALAEPITRAIELIVEAFSSGHKMLICGNGGSAADAQHFAAEFTGRYEMERTPLPAVALTTDTSALTAIGNDYGFDVVFSKQVEALGQAGDILYAISTSGNSLNVLKAMEVAKARGMNIIIMVGRDGGKMAKLLSDSDVNLCVPAERTARIQEVHLLTLHTICDGVDTVMFK
ncbi:MAG: phosphoheptose isomerase [Burkholderiales bacterium]|jgi:D-sedoheptulose 7-phosphate isomerase|nr:phosphoheptose isomerase [Burkholderiales bacterium]